MDNKEELIIFLEEVIDDLKTKNNFLTRLKVAEFYMKYKMENTPVNEMEFNKENIITFLILGWYIYTFGLNKVENNDV